MLAICCSGFHRLRLRCHCRFLCLGNNLLPDRICCILGLLDHFSATVINRRIGSVGTNVSGPGRSILAGIDILGIQFIGNTLTIHAECHSLLLCLGKLLLCCLLRQDIRKLHDIISFSQIHEPVSCCLTNGICVLCQNLLLIGLYQTVDLSAGEGFAIVQLFLVLHCQLVAEAIFCAFQSLLHKLYSRIAVSGFVFNVLYNGLICSLRTGVSCTGHKAAKHIKGNIFCHVNPCLLLSLFLTPSLAHVVTDKDIEVCHIAHGKLIGKVIQHRGDTFFQTFGNALLCNISDKLSHGCRGTDFQKIINTALLCDGFCCTYHSTVHQSVLIVCASLLRFINTCSGSRTEELYQSTNLTHRICSHGALRNAGTEAIYITKALATDDRDILIQCAVLIIQILRDAAGNCLGILKGSYAALLSNPAPGIEFCKVIQIIRKAEGRCKQCTCCMSGTLPKTTGCLLLDFLNLGRFFLGCQCIIDFFCILPCFLRVSGIQIAECIFHICGPLFRRFSVGGILAVVVRYLRNVCPGKGCIRSSGTKIASDCFQPGFILLLLLLRLLFGEILVPSRIGPFVIVSRRLYHFVFVGIQPIFFLTVFHIIQKRLNILIAFPIILFLVTIFSLCGIVIFFCIPLRIKLLGTGICFINLTLISVNII